MLRDKSLIPLSRQHQHALALCVRIERASPLADQDLAAWEAEIAQHFLAEIKIHFAAEEQIVFPEAGRFNQLRPLLQELLSDHAWLRERFAEAEAQTLTRAAVSEFAGRLAAHIRKEERQLFERMQALLSPDELARLGPKLDQALKEAMQACALPTRPVK